VIKRKHFTRVKSPSTTIDKRPRTRSSTSIYRPRSRCWKRAKSCHLQGKESKTRRQLPQWAPKRRRRNQHGLAGVWKDRGRANSSGNLILRSPYPGILITNCRTRNEWIKYFKSRRSLKFRQEALSMTFIWLRLLSTSLWILLSSINARNLGTSAILVIVSSTP